MARRTPEQSPPTVASEPRLMLEGGDGLPVILLAEGVTRVGRAPDCEVVLTDPSVSAEHCRLVRRGREVRVFDVGSTNGTMVRGKPAIGQLLAHGQELEIGRYRLTYQGPRLVGPSRQIVTALWLCAASAVLAVTVLVLAVLGVIDIGLRPLTWDEVQEVTEPDEQQGAAASSAAELELADRLDELLARLAEKERELANAREWHSAALAEVEKLGEEALAAQQEESRDELARLQEERRVLESERELLAGRIEQLVSARGPDPASDRDATMMVPADQGQPAVVQRREADRGAAPAPVGLPSAATGATAQWRSERELDEVASAVERVLDNHAGPASPAAEFSDPLATLVAHPGRHAAELVVQLYRHGRDLLTEVDELSASLAKRNASLHRKVKDGGKSASGSTRKQEGDLRLYELSAKKIEILDRSHDRLQPMVAELREAIRSLTSEDASLVLAETLRKERADVPYCLAVCDALVAARAEHAAGELIGLLAHADEALEARALQALIKLTGQDLGTRASAWKRWAKERGVE